MKAKLLMRLSKTLKTIKAFLLDAGKGPFICPHFFAPGMLTEPCADCLAEKSDREQMNH